jgi:hypothetical protein
MRAHVGQFVIAALLGLALPASAASLADLLRCDKAIHGGASTFAGVVQSALASCATKIESCQLAQEIDGEDPTQCLASASAMCGAYSAKVGAYRSAAESKAIVGCNTIPLGELEQYVAGLGFYAVTTTCATSTIFDLLDCVFDGAQCASERTLFTLDPRAGDALATAGIGAAHPCVGP